MLQRNKIVLATALSTYVGRAAQGFALILNMPQVAGHLNQECFGVWMMLTSLVAFLGFTDFGVGNSIINRVSKSRCNSDTKEMGREVASAFVFLSFVALSIFFLILLWRLGGGDIVVFCGKISEKNRPDVAKALVVFLVMFCVSIPFGLIQRIHLGAQQGYKNGIAQALSALLVTILINLQIQRGGDLSDLILVVLGVPTLINVISLFHWLINVFFKNGTAKDLIFNKIAAGGLLKDGLWFFGLQLSAAFAFQSDSIVLSQTVGQTRYAEYAVDQRLFLVLSSMISAALSGLWPAFADASNRKDHNWSMSTFKKYFIGTILISSFLSAVLCFAHPYLIKKWIADHKIRILGS